jgi:hypothetical protein
LGREKKVHVLGAKPAPVPLCPPQIPHAARTRTRAAALGNQRLTAWATTRPWWTLKEKTNQNIRDDRNAVSQVVEVYRMVDYILIEDIGKNLEKNKYPYNTEMLIVEIVKIFGKFVSKKSPKLLLILI